MAYTIKCQANNGLCQYSATADTEKEIWKMLLEHNEKVHGMKMDIKDPEVIKKLKSLTKKI